MLMPQVVVVVDGGHLAELDTLALLEQDIHQLAELVVVVHQLVEMLLMHQQIMQKQEHQVVKPLH